MYKYRLVLIGDITLPDNIYDTFSSDGYLITKTGGDDCYFEMSGESLYYALKDIERKYNENMGDYKSLVINAVKKRIEYCGGLLLHNSLAGNGESDTQLRASNSAIRTLLMAKYDGYPVDDIIKVLLDYHFKYYFIWKKGYWFCHDVSEKSGIKPRTHLKTKVLGKERRNTLTLNTHLDSLSTLLLVKKFYPNIDLSFSIDEYINKGVESLNQLLGVKPSRFNSFFQAVDNSVVKKINFNDLSRKDRFWTRLIHPFLFKLCMPTIFFNNGFIARDLAVLNIHMDYHVVNVVDFARFINLYNETSFERRIDIADLLGKLDKAVSLIENSKNIKSYYESNEMADAWYAEMYFALANIDNKYLMKARELSAKNIYNTYSPFFKDCFNEI